MSERINLNRFKKNLPPIKDVAKTTAAMTLLLSTAACVDKTTGYDNTSTVMCCIVPVLGYGVFCAVSYYMAYGGRSGGGGGGGGGGHGTPNTPGNY